MHSSQEENRQEFERLVSEYEDLVRRRLARISGSWELVDDLSQEVWHRAWKAWPAYTNAGQAPNWLMTICRTTWIDHCRRLSRRVSTEPLIETHHPVDPRSRSAGDTTEIDLLATLDDGEAQLAGYLSAGLSYREIAAALGRRAKSSLDGPVKRLRVRLRWLQSVWRPWAAAAVCAVLVAIFYSPSNISTGRVLMHAGPAERLDASSTAGVVAFASLVAGDPEIYLAAADGSWIRRVTRRLGADENPAISPDGAQLAYASQRNNRWNLVVTAMEGGSPTRLTPLSRSIEAVEGIAWTADGRLLAALNSPSRDGVGGCELYLIDARGRVEQVTASRRLETHFPTRRLSGDFLVQRNVPRSAAAAQVWAFDLATGQLTQLTDAPGGHYWPREFIDTSGTARLLFTNRQLFGPQLDHADDLRPVLGDFYEGYATTTPGRPGEYVVAATPFKRLGHAPSVALQRSAYVALRRYANGEAVVITEQNAFQPFWWAPNDN